MPQNLPYFWNTTWVFVYRRNKVAQNEKNYMGFHVPKIWHILLGNFLKHKPLIPEECHMYLLLCGKLEMKTR